MPPQISHAQCPGLFLASILAGHAQHKRQLASRQGNLAWSQAYINIERDGQKYLQGDVATNLNENPIGKLPSGVAGSMCSTVPDCCSAPPVNCRAPGSPPRIEIKFNRNYDYNLGLHVSWAVYFMINDPHTQWSNYGTMNNILFYNIFAILLCLI